MHVAGGRVVHLIGDGVSLPVHVTDHGPRLAGPGQGTDAGDLWTTLALLDDAGCSRYVVTDISREGSLSRPNIELFHEVCDRTAASVLAAGGIATLDDLRAVTTVAPHGVDGALPLSTSRDMHSQCLELACHLTGPDAREVAANRPAG
ncbi:HisA/HisF-related TIM barrel protein [Streptomyces sp. NPDC006692]|uniref:HisA/HisF-related TIM barrel protein n=1 Tax=unclassified Streptomyces TaxID=2593676 RepID=UPI00367CD7C3